MFINVLALGDPLIKGLTEVANNRPTDPITFLANYLHGFAKEKKMVSFRKVYVMEYIITKLQLIS